MYIKKHEGELKQSKQAKDIMAKYKAYMEKVSQTGDSSTHLHHFHLAHLHLPPHPTDGEKDQA